jgi:hypothetical protein
MCILSDNIFFCINLTVFWKCICIRFHHFVFMLLSFSCCCIYLYVSNFITYSTTVVAIVKLWIHEMCVGTCACVCVCVCVCMYVCNCVSNVCVFICLFIYLFSICILLYHYHTSRPTVFTYTFIRCGALMTRNILQETFSCTLSWIYQTIYPLFAFL